MYRTPPFDSSQHHPAMEDPVDTEEDPHVDPDTQDDCGPLNQMTTTTTTTTTTGSLVYPQTIMPHAPHSFPIIIPQAYFMPIYLFPTMAYWYSYQQYMMGAPIYGQPLLFGTPPFFTPQCTTPSQAGNSITNIVTFNEIGNNQSTNLKINKKRKLPSILFVSLHYMFPQVIKTRALNEVPTGPVK